jgi:hypothetical protein
MSDSITVQDLLESLERADYDPRGLRFPISLSPAMYKYYKGLAEKCEAEGLCFNCGKYHELENRVKLTVLSNWKTICLLGAWHGNT